MTKRLTAAEVAKNLVAASRGCQHVVMANVLRCAAATIEAHLVPQWQDEPDGDGWYWVEGTDYPCYIERSGAAWRLATLATWRPFSGRRVCPIGGRPE